MLHANVSLACVDTVRKLPQLYFTFGLCSVMRLTAFLCMAARVVVPKDYRYGTNRPWTEAAKRINAPGKKRRKVFVEPMAPQDWSVFRGDTVRNP